MGESVNEDIRDSFAEHDIDLRKLDGDIRNKVDAVLRRLGQDLKKLTLRIDPNSAQHLDARKRRVSRLRKEARPVISAAYVQIARIVKSDLRRLSKVESKASLKIIEDNLP